MSQFKLTRSKSMGTLDQKTNYVIEDDNSSAYSGACIIVDSRSDVYTSEDKISGATYRLDDERLSALEQKVTNLTDLLQEHCSLLQASMEELMSYKAVLHKVSAFENSPLSKEIQLEDLEKSEPIETEEQNDQAKNLLDAIETTQAQRTHRELTDILTKFLQCDDLKDRIASATADRVQDVIRTTFSETFPASYLPILEQSHQRLLHHVTSTLETAFNELEAGSSGIFKSVHGTSRSLRLALEKHQVLLETSKSWSIFDNFQNSLELILKSELKEWREKLIKMLLVESSKTFNVETVDPKDVPFSLASPPQPADPERSIIDQLMKSAEINKKIKEGDVNKSFEEALSSGDLSIVMAACKAADPAKIFTPCKLQQPVLLSLIQQLVTDMVHDTQLKSRYIEESIINLNTSDQATRAHLPLVVGEVRKHLYKFLRSYPGHVANRRLSLIIMAANNLLK